MVIGIYLVLRYQSGSGILFAVLVKLKSRHKIETEGYLFFLKYKLNSIVLICINKFLNTWTKFLHKKTLLELRRKSVLLCAWTSLSYYESKYSEYHIEKSFCSEWTSSVNFIYMQGKKPTKPFEFTEWLKFSEWAFLWLRSTLQSARCRAVSSGL